MILDSTTPDELCDTVRSILNEKEDGIPTPYDAFQMPVTFKKNCSDNFLVKDEDGVNIVDMVVTGVIDSHECTGGAEKVFFLIKRLEDATCLRI